MAAFFSLSGYLLAGLLVTSVLAKWKSRSRASLDATALGGLVRNRQLLVLLWWALIGFEGSVAILLVLAPPLVGGVAAVSFFSGAFFFLLVALRVAPGRPCGCFGSMDPSVSAKTAVRAVLLALIGALYAYDSSFPSQYLGTLRAWLGLGAMIAAVAALSSETDLVLAKLASYRAARCSDADDPNPAALTEMLVRTRAWRTLETHLVGNEPTDKWRQGCWYYVSYEALHEGAAATATFGLRLPPGRCRCHGVLRRGLIGQPLVALPSERIRWPRRAAWVGAVRT